MRATRDSRSGRSRRLRFEQLEMRTVLSTVTVGSADAFLDAIADANAADSAIGEIQFEEGLGTIQIGETAAYTGGQALTIDGNGVTIEPAGDAIDLFTSTGDADLTFRELTLQGGTNGISVLLSAEAEGEVSVALDDVVVQQCAEFGVHIDDLAGSDAGINLDISGGSFTANGTAVGDRDGIRVDERGDGGIVANVSNTNIDANGGDGLELDEGGDGSVELQLTDSTVNGNGFVDAAEPGAEEPDLDDGIDIDEAGGGDLTLVVSNCDANGNFNQGFDIDEEDGGDMDVRFQNVNAIDNIAEGIKVDEKEGDITGGGSLYAVLEHVVSNGSAEQEGIVLAEEGGGSLIALLNDVTANGNDKEGIELEETGGGSLIAQLNHIEASENDDDGLQITEEDGGSLKASLVDAVFNSNKKYGLKVEQADGGRGKLALADLIFDGLNNDGEEDQWKAKGVVWTLLDI